MTCLRSSPLHTYWDTDYWALLSGLFWFCLALVSACLALVSAPPFVYKMWSRYQCQSSHHVYMYTCTLQYNIKRIRPGKGYWSKNTGFTGDLLQKSGKQARLLILSPLKIQAELAKIRRYRRLCQAWFYRVVSWSPCFMISLYFIIGPSPNYWHRKWMSYLYGILVNKSILTYNSNKGLQSIYLLWKLKFC